VLVETLNPAQSNPMNTLHLSSVTKTSHNYVQVEVPKANSVAVVVGEDWTQLEVKGGAGSAWEGEVNMERRWGRELKVALCANFGTVKASYSTLLEYSL